MHKKNDGRKKDFNFEKTHIHIDLGYHLPWIWAVLDHLFPIFPPFVAVIHDIQLRFSSKCNFTPHVQCPFLRYYAFLFPKENKKKKKKKLLFLSKIFLLYIFSSMCLIVVEEHTERSK